MAQVSHWNLDNAALPPAQYVTPQGHTCTEGVCRFHILDQGVLVCRASSAIHVCSRTQCKWAKRVHLPQKVSKMKTHAAHANDAAEDLSQRICWASNKDLDDLTDSFIVGETSRSMRPQRLSAGNEQRLITFKDQATGKTVSKLVNAIPTQEDYGEAVDIKQEAKEDAVVVEMNKEASETRNVARTQELERLQRKRKRDVGDDPVLRKNDLEAWRRSSKSEDVGLGDGRSRARFSVKDLRRRMSLDAKQRRNKILDLSDTSDNDDQEKDFDEYHDYVANVLDDADYDRAEEIGDYKTAYTKTGGVEAYDEEDEDLYGIELEQHEETQRRMYQEMLGAYDPKKPIEWYGNPSIGKAITDSAGSEGHGAIREYDGRLYKILEMPPVFGAEKAPVIPPGQCYLTRDAGEDAKVKTKGRRKSKHQILKEAQRLAPPPFVPYRPGGGETPNATSGGEGSPIYYGDLAGGGGGEG